MSSQPDGRFQNCWPGGEEIRLIQNERNVTEYLGIYRKSLHPKFSTAGFDIFHQTNPCQGFTEAESREILT